MVRVHLQTVGVDMASNSPVLLLREDEGDRAIKIYIGAPEATAIAYAVQHVPTPRPMTHDLMIDLLGALGATLDRVVVTEVREATFFAELHLAGPSGPLTLSARPSDAIAIALRADAPIFATAALMESVGMVLVDEEVDEEIEEEELVDEFRAFLDSIGPDDFQAS